MGVYIKGMEMPMRGMVVNIYGDGRVTNHFDEFGKTIGEAVPIPPHGRLIDADLLSKILKNKAADEWNKKVSPLSWSYAYECLVDILDCMPTIIEAEEKT